MRDVRMREGRQYTGNSECKFCSLLRGELHATMVFEWPKALAFLDHRPLFPGHCLLIPRDHVETLGDLPLVSVGPFFRSVQQLAGAVKVAMQAEGTFIGINNRVSQSVPHLHVHVVPRRKEDGMRGFFWPRQKYPDAAAEIHVAKAIRAVLNGSQPSRPKGTKSR